jgi:hypothetical protein
MICLKAYKKTPSYENVNPESLIPAETVEKPKKHDFKVYNYLILLHAKFVTMPELDFFDSLAM